MRDYPELKRAIEVNLWTRSRERLWTAVTCHRTPKRRALPASRQSRVIPGDSAKWFRFVARPNHPADRPGHLLSCFREPVPVSMRL
jgi:hypothetical protein